MIRLLTPPVAELINAPTDSVEEAIAYLCKFYERDGRFNYLPATKTIKSAYKGLHKLEVLLAGFTRAGVGVSANRNVVELASPFAFGRSTRVFDLPPRKFPFGRDRAASYRIPFFFVEAGVIKLYFLLPRKGPYLSLDGIAGCASIQRKFLLEQEFYGEKVEVEIVDLSASVVDGQRVPKRFSLADLGLWSDARIERHVRIVAEAMDRIERNDLVKVNKRKRPLRDTDLPLFD